MFHTAEQNNTANKIDNGIYSAEASQLTYTHLSALATTIIDAGFSVIIDAAFLKHEQRVPFQRLAGYLNVPYFIIEVTAPDDVLRTRIKQRKNGISDADLSVLEHQLSSWQPLRESEMATAITVNSTSVLDTDALTNKINKI
jgi:predicted kinase